MMIIDDYSFQVYSVKYYVHSSGYERMADTEIQVMAALTSQD